MNRHPNQAAWRFVDMRTYPTKEPGHQREETCRRRRSLRKHREKDMTKSKDNVDSRDERERVLEHIKQYLSRRGGQLSIREQHDTYVIIFIVLELL